MGVAVGVLTSCVSLSQILVLELNDEAAEQTVEAKIVDLLQGQEGFRWKVRRLMLQAATSKDLFMRFYALW